MVAPDLVQRIETMPLAMVTVLPLSVRVTFGPLVPPPGRLARTGLVVSSKASKHSKNLIRRQRGILNYPAILNQILTITSSGDGGAGAHFGTAAGPRIRPGSQRKLEQGRPRGFMRRDALACAANRDPALRDGPCLRSG